LEALGVQSKQVDIGTDPATWGHLFRGCDGVFHTAAKVDMWGDLKSFFATNVLGTRNILKACTENGVKGLVFTSSPSVIHDGTDLENVDESYPYPKHFDAFYPQTKAQAEQEVLSANGQGVLRTVSLRPHLIWGPNDTNLIPTVLERARAGKLTRIGKGDNLVDLCFIDDCVEAHILAMQALEAEPQKVGGRAYFISQGEPIRLWGWIDDVLAAHGLPKVTRSISVKVAHGLATLMEGISKALACIGIKTTPLLTRFLVSEMATHHYFNITRAKEDLGYHPSCTIADALRRTFSGTEA
jgi:nucleoside-diphosphate-sugar epimerase